MKIKDIHIGEKNQKTEEENKYIPGSSEKKRASMMYLFFGIIVSLSKKEFSPFELYHLRQSIGLWILILPIVLISCIPVIRILGIIILIGLLGILGFSFANAWNGKYLSESDKSILALFSGVGGRFLDLFELGIKSTGAESKTNSGDVSTVSTSELERDIQEAEKESIDENQAEESDIVTSEDLQKQDTSLQEDVEKLDENDNSTEENTPEEDKA